MFLPPCPFSISFPSSLRTHATKNHDHNKGLPSFHSCSHFTTLAQTYTLANFPSLCIVAILVSFSFHSLTSIGSPCFKVSRKISEKGELYSHVWCVREIFPRGKEKKDNIDMYKIDLTNKARFWHILLHVFDVDNYKKPSHWQITKCRRILSLLKLTSSYYRSLNKILLSIFWDIRKSIVDINSFHLLTYVITLKDKWHTNNEFNQYKSQKDTWLFFML